MRFRRRRFSPRRRRSRWDMQTFRDCERDLELIVDADNSGTCAQPQIFADLLCGPVASTDTPMIQGASRAMMYGGGHLQYRYNVALLNSDLMPCPFQVKVVTAMVVLPLAEDDLTPAYLPNLAVARSQISVVHSTQSDTDENILYWRDDQLSLTNLSCNGSAGVGNCLNPILGIGCGSGLDAIGQHLGTYVIAIDTVLHGRLDVTERIRVKRRLREREALFLLSEWVVNAPTSAAFTWPIRRTVYHRYAVRPSR